MTTRKGLGNLRSAVLDQEGEKMRREFDWKTTFIVFDHVNHNADND